LLSPKADRCELDSVRPCRSARRVAVLLALGSQSAHAAGATADSDSFQAFVYDAHVFPDLVTDGAAVRGPPANFGVLYVWARRRPVVVRLCRRFSDGRLPQTLEHGPTMSSTVSARDSNWRVSPPSLT
jgi:hypothetical protein